MKFLKKKLHKSTFYLMLAFLIPIVIGIIGFLCCLYQSKSGNLTIIYGDLKAQYTSLFTYLQDVLHGESSISYSFSKGLGGGMISTFAYYLMSPFNLIVGLFSASDIPMILLGLIIFKMGLSGLFSYIFLSKYFKIKDYRLLIFSTCYALSAYVVNWHFCIMWLDAVYMLPLILLGIHKLVEGKSSLLYVISLMYTIFCNYYIGYMLCIFSCIYFIFEIIMQCKYKDKKQLLHTIIRFAVSSLCAGMLCMIVIVPTVVDLSNTARSFGHYAGVYTLETTEHNFDILKLLYRLLIGSADAESVTDYDVINIYFGVIMLPLIYFYFINRDIDKKKKLFSIGIIILFLLSYSIKYFDYAWHGFAFPNGLNYRFSFLFIFYFVIICCHSFLKLSSISKKHYFIFLVLFFIIMNILCLFGYRTNLISIYVSSGCVIFYLLIFYLLHHRNINSKQQKELSVLLVIFVSAELVFNLYISLHSYFAFTTKEYTEYVETYGNVIDKYDASENEFYRMNQSDYFNSNPGLLFNYYGMQSFLSTMNIGNLNFFRVNGYFANEISLVYTLRSHYLIDSLMGLRYYIVLESGCKNYDVIDTFEYSLYSNIFYGLKQANYNVCENKNHMNLGFMIHRDWRKQYGSDVDEFSYLEVSSSVLNSMILGNNEYYVRYEPKQIGKNQYQLVADDSDLIYISYIIANSDGDGEIKIDVDGERVYTSLYPDMVVAIENKYKGKEIIISAEYGDNPSGLGNFIFYHENTELINESLNLLKEHQLELTYFKDNHIKGKVTAKEDMSTLFTSIPYEKGWTLYVDGRKTEIECLYNAFIGVTLTEGEHEIELVYHVPGLKLGSIVSGISLLLTVIYLIFERKKLDLYAKFQVETGIFNKKV